MVKRDSHYSILSQEDPSVKELTIHSISNSKNFLWGGLLECKLRGTLDTIEIPDIQTTFYFVYTVLLVLFDLVSAP